jgi:DNA modification methylase
VEKNQLYYGDNLEVLRQHIKDESADLIYLDPPFNSRQDYNVLFAEKDGTRSSSQIMAFEDTWEWNVDAERAYEEIVEQGGRVSDAMRAFRTFLGHSDMMAYLAMMAPRLIELKRVLKVTGSIYLHCDPTASHYLKMLMDAIFGPQFFRNEIIWRRSGSHNSAKRFGPIHDVLLFYGKTRDPFFKRQFRPYLKQYVESFFNKTDEKGRYRSQTLTGSGTRRKDSGQPWRGFDPTAKGRHWAFPGVLAEELGLDPDMSLAAKLDVLWDEQLIAQTVDGLPEYRQYLHQSKGNPLQDIWSYQPYTQGLLQDCDEAIDQDVKWLEKRGGDERLGYPTQKPEGLLERVISSSSRAGDTVLDPFCGCGAAISVAQRLNRRWIGIDITHLAIGLIKKRLDDAFEESVRSTYEVIGEPVDLTGAQNLATSDPYQFQWWSLGLVGARPNEKKKGADQGIDGRLYFHDEPRGGKTKQIIFSVKAGHVQSAYVRDLRGVIEREEAQIGVLISIEAPTKPMLKEAAEAGFYKPPGLEDRYPRIQILTIEELLAGKRVEYPRLLEVTFKKAPKARPAAERRAQLPFDPVEDDEGPY